MAVGNAGRGTVTQKWEDNKQRDVAVEDVRQASPLGHIRYVLGISLALVIVLFAIIYFSFSHTW
jgi:hypothetical protein